MADTSSPTNAPDGDILDGVFSGSSEQQPHPAEQLFQIDPKNLAELLLKSDIPEQMVGPITRMLWISERYDVKSLRSLITWYLLTRLGTNRQARKEFMEVLMNAPNQGDEDAFISS